MQAIVLVLNKVDCLEHLLVTLSENGIHGGTIIESTGMAHALAESDEYHIIGSLRKFLDPTHVKSKTIFFVVKNEQASLVRRIIDEVVGDLSQPDTGIVFGVNLDFVDGVVI